MKTYKIKDVQGWTPDNTNGWTEKDFGLHGEILKPAYHNIINHILLIFPWIHTLYEWNVVIPREDAGIFIIQGYLSDYARLDFIVGADAPKTVAIRLSGRQVKHVGEEENVIIKKMKCDHTQTADLIGGMSMLLGKYFSWAMTQDDFLEPNYGEMLFRPYMTTDHIKTTDTGQHGQVARNLTISHHSVVWVNPLQTTLLTAPYGLFVPDGINLASIKNIQRCWVHPVEGLTVKQMIEKKLLKPFISNDEPVVYPPDMETL